MENSFISLPPFFFSVENLDLQQQPVTKAYHLSYLFKNADTLVFKYGQKPISLPLLFSSPIYYPLHTPHPSLLYYLGNFYPITKSILYAIAENHLPSSFILKTAFPSLKTQLNATPFSKDSLSLSLVFNPSYPPYLVRNKLLSTH